MPRGPIMRRLHRTAVIGEVAFIQRQGPRAVIVSVQRDASTAVVRHLKQEFFRSRNTIERALLERFTMPLGQKPRKYRRLQHHAMVVHRMLHIAAIGIHLPPQFVLKERRARDQTNAWHP